ncbi:MAG: putative ABC transporter permease [Lachnospiraceae bacterium]|nr:putative ABC transporter permease [Lachnospiraceae bacterium]
MKNRFIRCGMYGWCMEVLWTGLHSLLNRDPKLMGFSSLRMFPIYGMASLIAPFSHVLKKFNTITRGLIYMVCIFTVEFVSGSWLKKRGRCPWDYSDSPWQVNGVIRLDYAPIWFLTGLFFEKTGKSQP